MDNEESFYQIQPILERHIEEKNELKVFEDPYGYSWTVKCDRIAELEAENAQLKERIKTLETYIFAPGCEWLDGTEDV